MWDKVLLPVLKKPFAEMPSIKEFMSTQPLIDYDAPPSYIEPIDLSNPRVGVVVCDGDKNPHVPHGFLCGCVREEWHKIWTPRCGWVREKEDPKKFRRMVKKYHAKYKAMIVKERKAWNKKHGIDDSLCIPTSLIFDSKKQR